MEKYNIHAWLIINKTLIWLFLSLPFNIAWRRVGCIPCIYSKRAAIMSFETDINDNENESNMQIEKENGKTIQIAFWIKTYLISM